MRMFVLKFVLFLSILAGSVGLKSIQFRLEGISAEQIHLSGVRGSSGGPSRTGGGVRRLEAKNVTNV